MTSRYPLILAAVGLFTVVQAGNDPPALPEQPATAAPQPDRIALLDMAAVFKQSALVKAKMDQLKAEVQKADLEAQAMVAEMQKRKTEASGLGIGTPERDAAEEELTRLKLQFEGFRSKAQRDFQRKEVEIYRTVYLLVTELIKEYAKKQGYTLVMRFSRDNVGDTNDPKEVVQRITNAQHVYYDSSRDITDAIIQQFNEKHKPEL